MTENVMQNQVKVGLIATGDELTQGDILNTNGQEIAETLHELGFLVNQHVIVDDNEHNISAAISFLAKEHDIIILSGGLGPTSDDRTRFALATALQKELIFDDASWQAIVTRLSMVHLASDDHNRQQALFPEGATVLPNPNGTAAACRIGLKNVTYFMLPGPPHECLPIFHQQVVPMVAAKAQAQHHFKWLLLGASEGDIAAKLDDALCDINCRTGYRWAYPYLEFKANADTLLSLEQAEKIAEPIIAPYLASKQALDYQQQLTTLLANTQHQLYFDLAVLSQFVQAALLSNQTADSLTSASSEQCVQISISGLAEYWQQATPPTKTTATIKLVYQDKNIEHNLSLYYRDQRVLQHLVAVSCKAIVEFLSTI